MFLKGDTMEQNKNVNEVKEVTEIDAFEADKKLAEFQNRVEKGLLTEEEKKSRKEFLEFLGYKE